MKKTEFKGNFYKMLDEDLEGFTFDEKMNYVNQLIISYEADNESKRDISKKGQKWTDEELKIILSDAPTKANCLKYAKLFKRGYGSIEQIYRWSTTAEKEMTEERQQDSFIQQIKHVSRELGLRG